MKDNQKEMHSKPKVSGQARRETNWMKDMYHYATSLRNVSFDYEGS
jgi:hypothetical protein